MVVVSPPALIRPRRTRISHCRSLFRPLLVDCGRCNFEVLAGAVFARFCEIGAENRSFASRRDKRSNFNRERRLRSRIWRQERSPTRQNVRERPPGRSILGTPSRISRCHREITRDGSEIETEATAVSGVAEIPWVDMS